jgi:membrane-bound inhibitor of C-type lysozyme
MKNIFIVLVVLLLGVGVWYVLTRNDELAESAETEASVTEGVASEPELVASVRYMCEDEKSIEAEYYQISHEGHDPSEMGHMPEPTGSVELVLSDGRELTLPQTISASGIRYANADESFIFWSKGNEAFVMEGEEETFTSCVEEVSE